MKEVNHHGRLVVCSRFRCFGHPKLSGTGLPADFQIQQEERHAVSKALSRTVLALLLLDVVLSLGCGLTPTEISSALQSGGTSYLSITTPQILDGVEGRSYFISINTSGGSGVLASCAIISGSLPPGFEPPTVQQRSCVLTSKGQPVAGSGNFTFTLEATDTSNPARSDQRPYTLTIRKPFSFAAFSAVDGIAGRSYTRVVTVATNVQNLQGQSEIGSSSAGNGPLVSCSVTGLPAAFSAGGGTVGCAPDSTGVNLIVTMKAPAGALATGVYSATLSAQDSAIYLSAQTAPVVPAATATLSTTLVVRNEFQITQSALVDAVQGRTYGVTPLAQPVQTDVVAASPVSVSPTSEFGNGPLTGCNMTMTPSNPGLAITAGPANSSQCLIQSTSPLTPAGTYSVTVSATDTPIMDPVTAGQVVVPSNALSKTFSLTVNNPLSFTVNFDNYNLIAAEVPDAVQSRTYGAGGGGGQTSLIFTAAGGLLATDGITISASGTLPTPIVCRPATANPQIATASLICDSEGTAVSSPASSYSMQVLIADSGNAATPPGSSTTDALGHTSHTLLVDSPLAAFLTQAGNPVATNPPNLVDAVSGRSYGVTGGLPTYSPTGGLGNGYYQWCISNGALPAGFGNTGSNLNAGCSAQRRLNSVTLQANPIAALVSSPTPYNFTVQLNDTGNATTPAGTVTYTTTLELQPPLTAILSQAGNPVPINPSNLLPGVTNRSYGVIGGTPTYSATGGISQASVGGGSYQWCVSAGTLPPIIIGISTNCSAPTVSNTATLSTSANGTVGANGTYTPTIRVDDQGNTAVPGGVASGTTNTNTTTLVIAPALHISADPTALAPPAGVQGRTYGNTVAGFEALVYSASAGLTGYQFNPPPTGLPAGITCVPDSPTSKLTCTSGTAAITATPGPYSFTVTLDDTGNAATPSGGISSTVATVSPAMVINSPLSLTAPSSAPAGVTGRHYGQGTGCSPSTTCSALLYSIQNGLGGFSASPTTGGFPANFSCAFNSTGTLTGSYACSSLSVGGSGSFALTLTASDTANGTTPSGSVTSPAVSLTVNPEMTFPVPSQPPPTLPPAVTGRSYGSGAATCSSGPCQPLVYTVSTGSGLGAYTFAANNFPSGITCAPSPTSMTCSSAGALAASPGNYTGINVTVTDSANQSTPNDTVTSLTDSLTVHSELNFTGQPSATLSNAVTGRAYGDPSTICIGGAACQGLVYTVAAGSGLGTYSFTPISMPAGFSCSTSSNVYTCAALQSTGGVTATTGTYSGISAKVTDAANTATPNNSATSPTLSNLTVNAEMSFSPTPPATLPPAVQGRSYGQAATGCSGGACVAPSYAVVSGSGLGGYSFFPTGFPAGMVCVQGLGPASNTASCSSPSITASPQTSSITMGVKDTPNVSTPSNTITTSTESLVVNAALAVALTQSGNSASPNPPNLLNGVTQRNYGAAGGTPTYTASGGLGGYAFPATPGPFGASSGFTCSPTTSNPYSCSASPLGLAGSTTAHPISLTVKDTANTAAPQGTATSNTNLLVNPEMNFTATPTSPFATAVVGRSYGQGSTCGMYGNVACAPLTYTIQSGSGLGGYSYAFTLNSGNGGFTCSAGGTSSNCTSGGVTGAAGTYSSVYASVTDTANAATPSKTVVSSNATLTVNAALALNSPASPYPDGENHVTYGSASSICSSGAACTPLTYTVPYVASPSTIAGLPPYVFSESGFPTNLNCTPSDIPSPAPAGNHGIYTCEAQTGISAPGPFPQVFSPTVQVTDTPNASVPSTALTNPLASLTVQPQLSILDTVLPNGLLGFVYNPSGPGVTIKSQGGIGAVTWVGPGGSAVGACAAPPAGTLPTVTAMTFNTSSQLFSTSGAAFATGDASTSDGQYTFQVCVTDTGNAATPQTAALPNPGASSPLVANYFVFNVLNTFAYVAEQNTDAVDVINTTSNSLVGSAISLGGVGVAPTGGPHDVAITPDGTRAYVTLTSNQFAVIDTITNSKIVGSPFSLPAASTCLTLGGVAITNDGRAYFSCPTSTGNGATGVVDVISTADNATLVGEIATGGDPSGVAVSPTVDPSTGKTSQVYVTLASTNELAIIANTANPALSTTVALTPTNSIPDGLAAVVKPSGDVYVYIAKSEAGTGNPGVDIVDAKSQTLLSSSFAFDDSNQSAAGVAVTPDANEVYVTVSDSTDSESFVWVVDNTISPKSRTGSPFNLPDPANTVGWTDPVGVTIPPLSPTPANGFYVYVAQEIAGDVDVLQDYPLAAKPVHKTAVTLTPTGPRPYGIASIPLPAAPPNLP